MFLYLFYNIDCYLYTETRVTIHFGFLLFQTINAGDLSERFKLKEKLQCKNFTWFITNVWQELSIFDHNVFAWGSVSISSYHQTNALEKSYKGNNQSSQAKGRQTNL